jgi:hypothetical protein
MPSSGMVLTVSSALPSGFLTPHRITYNTKMSLKSELLINQAALEAYDERQLSTALTQFAKIAETSKVQWNMGAILASMGRHDEAIARFGESTLMDQYLVVGWYQRGVSYFVSPVSVHTPSHTQY